MPNPPGLKVGFYKACISCPASLICLGQRELIDRIERFWSPDKKEVILFFRDTNGIVREVEVSPECPAHLDETVHFPAPPK